ncbi:MAG: RnfABCDGE type electron transport complex subunit B [Methanophagales archaeon ANME-1-THS]|nr:MAG: RnfABCDGE type electron transport complex subunit B [Methanophagales archaeon ANME-1-THS]
MIEAVTILGILGVLFGMGLAYASKRFEVPLDPRVGRILDALPGSNCGTCGFASCDEFATALVKDPSLVTNCKACVEESWLKICDTLGLGVEKRKQELALVACSCDSVAKFDYDGVKSCAVAALSGGGFTTCKYACLGFGDCVKACPFGAIEKRGYQFFVDFDKCIGCGACVDACPRGLIKIVDKNATVFVRCNSRDTGKTVAKICESGCIACKLCEKACEQHAIRIENNLAIIDYDRCTNCGKCIEACKFGTILSILPPRKAVAEAAQEA